MEQLQVIESKPKIEEWHKKRLEDVISWGIPIWEYYEEWSIWKGSERYKEFVSFVRYVQQYITRNEEHKFHIGPSVREDRIWGYAYVCKRFPYNQAVRIKLTSHKGKEYIIKSVRPWDLNEIEILRKKIHARPAWMKKIPISPYAAVLEEKNNPKAKLQLWGLEYLAKL